jgi:hypothetical protein
MDTEFGHWLAGFIAGEGCFAIARNHGCWVISFTLTQRDDDAAIIYEIQDRLGFGTIHRSRGRGNSKPQITWQVARVADQCRLVQILDRFPMRARKTEDYHIWRQAVLAKSTKDLGRIDALVPKLKAARAYKAASA